MVFKFNSPLKTNVYILQKYAALAPKGMQRSEAWRNAEETGKFSLYPPAL